MDAFAFPDGEVFLKSGRPGIADATHVPATAISSLHGTSFEGLLDTLDDMELRRLAGEYDTPAVCNKIYTDHSTLILEVNAPRRQDKIVYYLGCKGFAEEQAVRSIFETVQTALGVSEFVGAGLSPD
ncbi:MAG: hypothetical protein H6847_14800 [Hyphomonas sp.]|nr:hypothetical protein [Hyphomonas sp.]MCB9960552.1 hypothetical protein [Hyphomonas sp.]MCB9972775.1 hypothetical protein [Hyphomonas sp.]